MNADVRSLCGVSAVTANRILADLVTQGKLAKYTKMGTEYTNLNLFKKGNA